MTEGISSNVSGTLRPAHPCCIPLELGWGSLQGWEQAGGARITFCVQLLSRRCWMWSCKEEESVNERVTNAAGSWRWPWKSMTIALMGIKSVGLFPATPQADTSLMYPQ